MNPFGFLLALATLRKAACQQCTLGIVGRRSSIADSSDHIKSTNYIKVNKEKERRVTSMMYSVLN
jgi:uncharacterized protein YydD (DUF2326 family)